MKYSPEQLMYGYCRNEADLLKKQVVVQSIDDYVALFTNHIDEMHLKYATRREEINDRHRVIKNKTKEERTFEVAVLEQKISEGTGGSTKAKYTPRYRITKKAAHLKHTTATFVLKVQRELLLVY